MGHSQHDSLLYPVGPFEIVLSYCSIRLGITNLVFRSGAFDLSCEEDLPIVPGVYTLNGNSTCWKIDPGLIAIHTSSHRSHQILQGLFLNSSVAELYSCVKEQLGFKNFFNLSAQHTCGRWCKPKNVITNADDSLSVFINLKGAGHDTSDRGRAKHSQPRIPETSVSGYSLRRLRLPSREIQIQPLVQCMN